MAIQTKRSYLGVGSCALFAIATAALLTVNIINSNATYKMAGFEIIVVGPFALALYLAGLVFGLSGMKDRNNNHLSRTGASLNAIPVAYIIAMSLFAMIRGVT